MADHALRRDTPITDLDAWLREHLGRRLAVAFVAPVGEATSDHQIESLTRMLDGYAEIRVIPPDLNAKSVQQQIDSLRVLDPEVVLVVAPTAGESTASDAERERGMRELLERLEQAGILDRAFLALLGPVVTREQARRLGFEDGFASEIAATELAGTLAREGVAVDERRRRGSNPPCYL